jgi:hypothetical protein
VRQKVIMGKDDLDRHAFPILKTPIVQQSSGRTQAAIWSRDATATGPKAAAPTDASWERDRFGYPG